MILWFLRLFPAFVALEARAADLQAQIDASDDQFEYCGRELAQAEKSRDVAESRVEDLKRMVDALSYRCDRRYVFGNNESAPAAKAPEPIQYKRQFARDIIQQRTREAMDAIRALETRDMSQMTPEQEIEMLRREATETMQSAEAVAE